MCVFYMDFALAMRIITQMSHTESKVQLVHTRALPLVVKSPC